MNRIKYKGVLIYTNIESSDNFNNFATEINNFSKASVLDGIEIFNIVGVNYNKIEEEIYNRAKSGYLQFAYIKGRLMAETANILLRAVHDKRLTICTYDEEDSNMYKNLYEIVYNFETKDIICTETELSTFILDLKIKMGLDKIFIGIASEDKKFVMNLFSKIRKLMSDRTDMSICITKNSCVPLSFSGFTQTLMAHIAPNTQYEELNDTDIKYDPKVASVNKILSFKLNDATITYHYIKPSTITDFSNIDLYNALYIDLNSHYKTLVLPNLYTETFPFTRFNLASELANLLAKHDIKDTNYQSFINEQNNIENKILNQQKNIIRYFPDIMSFDSCNNTLDKYGMEFLHTQINMNCPVLR